MTQTVRYGVFVDDARRRDWVGRSHVRTRAQSRANVERPARAQSLCGPTQIADDDSAARGRARLIVGAYSRRRVRAGTPRGTSTTKS